jgi:hypothetical protein
VKLIRSINLKLKTIKVKSKSRKLRSDIEYIIDDPIYDIHPDAAKQLGTTQDEYRKEMNTEENYKTLLDRELELF